MSLTIEPKGPNLSAFEYNRDLLKAAMANTYVETVSSRADSLHLAIKNAPASNFYWEYLRTIGIVGKRFELEEREVILAFDYTSEEFYGDVQGFWIYKWTGENAITGKFHFLTCALVESDIPVKIPLISIPVYVGHNMAKEVCFCLSLIRPLVKSIKLILFDRGFYSKELMLTLGNIAYPYLIFVPKNRKIKRELDNMAKKERKTINYEFEVNKEKSTLKGNTTLAFLKEVYDKRTDRNYDWTFATNMEIVELEHLIAEYKKRWRIETMFRIQDEARIKSKSKDMKIRFFYFIYEQMLQFLWAALYKDKLSFKAFIIEMYEMSNERVVKAERKKLRKSR